MKKLRTAPEAKAWLAYQGISISQWSRDHNFHPSLVREILAGRKKCAFGASHNIAVALGMKVGQRTDKPGRATQHAALSGVAA
jgi:gp16 family phage-associated protein